MKIAIPVDLLVHKTLTGVERYLYHLVHSLTSLDEIEMTLICPPDMPLDCLPEKVTLQKHQIIDWFGAKYFFPIFQGLKNINHFDLIHCPTVIAPFFFKPRNKVKVVMTVHDLVPALFPKFTTAKKFVYYKYALRFIFRFIDHFIVPSRSVRNDLIKLYSIRSDQISVVYEGVSENYKASREKKQDFILAVSTIEPRKNFKRIIDAYLHLKTNFQINEKLVIVGRKGWRCDEVFHRINKYKENIIYKNYVPEDNLIELYRNAKVFVYPSLYEGFGLPVAEAMACGCPVVTSNLSSLPEVADGAALLVNPHNVNDIAQAILRILQDEKLASSLVEKGLKQVTKFTWAKCTQETIKVYEKVLK